MILTNELCANLSDAALKKSKELGIDISFAICDENGLLKVFHRFGEALVLSITLVPGKAYTSAITQSKTKDIALLRSWKGDRMKQIQIPEQLFMELVKFHLLDMEENLPSIKQGLEMKLDALVMRDLYSKYKTAPTAEEREQARKEYLDRREVSEKFRW